MLYLLIALTILLILGLIYANRKQAGVTLAEAPAEPELNLDYKPPVAAGAPGSDNGNRDERDPALARMTTRDLVLEVLRECYDPEIPLNIVDLGLIYDVDVQKDGVRIKMSLTAPGCPSGDQITFDAQSRLKEAGFPDPRIELIWEPPWTAQRISEEGRKSLGI